MKQTLQLKVSAHLALTPQLQQSIKLLQMSTVELNEEVERLLQENPMLERTEPVDEGFSVARDDARQSENAGESESFESDSPVETTPTETGDTLHDWLEGFSIGRTGSSDDDEDASFESFIADSESLSDHLIRQLALTAVSDRDRQLVQILIDSLDDDGYLETSLEELLESISPETGVTIEEMSVALALLQHFDPSGVGARSPAECLRLQIDAENDDPVAKAALAIIDGHLDLLAARDYAKLKKTLGCGEADLKEAIALIVSLNPRPGAPFAKISTRYITPDVIVRKHKGRWIVSLNEETIPKLKINRLYALMLSSGSIGKKDAETLNGQLQEARWFLKNIQQRFETILRVTNVIVEKQSDFLEHGEIAMRPLVLREIAKRLDLHESTISRVTNQKYIQTPRGIYELKYFFASHCATETGGACSSTAIKALIRQLVQQEDDKKPLSDNKIAQMLGEQGIVVARRTVAKYRELMQIPPVNQRKTI